MFSIHVSISWINEAADGEGVLGDGDGVLDVDVDDPSAGLAAVRAVMNDSAVEDEVDIWCRFAWAGLFKPNNGLADCDCACDCVASVAMNAGALVLIVFDVNNSIGGRREILVGPVRWKALRWRRCPSQFSQGLYMTEIQPRIVVMGQSRRGPTQITACWHGG